MSSPVRTQLWLALALCLSAHPARASDLELRLGVKGSLNLAGAIETGSPPPAAAWANSSPGFGGGGGVYGDLHINQIFGLELDLLLDSNRIYFSSEAPALAFEQRASFEQLRLPLLAKVYWPVSSLIELQLGLGPMFSAGVGARAKTTATRSAGELTMTQLNQLLSDRYTAENRYGLSLAFELGMSFVTDRFHVPIALRFAYNVLAPADYDDRVLPHVDMIGSTVKAIESYQVSLCVGFGFVLPPKKPNTAEPVNAPTVDDPFSPLQPGGGAE